MTAPEPLEIAVIGQLMADASRPNKRHYANLVVTVKSHDTLLGCWHITNYQINSKSLTRRCTIKRHDTFAEAERALKVKHRTKLARDRVEAESWLESFVSLTVLERWLASPGPLLKIGDAKKLCRDIVHRRTELDVPFETRVADELAVIDTEREKAAGVGLETAKTNKKWGLF